MFGLLGAREIIKKKTRGGGGGTDTLRVMTRADRLTQRNPVLVRIVGAGARARVHAPRRVRTRRPPLVTIIIIIIRRYITRRVLLFLLFFVFVTFIIVFFSL